MASLDPNLKSTLGALQIGSFFSIFLFGVLCVQCHLYFGRFPSDWWLFKALVTSVWLLETAHTICVGHDVFRIAVTLSGHPERLATFVGFALVVLFGAVITMLVQTFLALRLWKLLPPRYRYLGLACCGISLLRFAASIFIAAQAVAASSIIAFRDEWVALITTVLVVGAAVDVLISASMLWFLIYQRHGLDAQNRVAPLIDRLVAWTIRTGLFTSIGAVVLVVCFQMMPDNFVWIALYTCLAKFYSNTFLSALNARHHLRSAINRPDGLVEPPIPSAYGTGPPGPRNKADTRVSAAMNKLSEADFDGPQMYAEDIHMHPWVPDSPASEVQPADPIEYYYHGHGSSPSPSPPRVSRHSQRSSVPRSPRHSHGPGSLSFYRPPQGLGSSLA